MSNTRTPAERDAWGSVRQAELHRQIALADVGWGVKAAQQLRRRRLAVDLDLRAAHAECCATWIDELHGRKANGHFIPPIADKVPASACEKKTMHLHSIWSTKLTSTCGIL